MRLFSKRTARWSSLLAATAFLLVACEPEVSVDPRTDYWAGTWTCNEQTGDLAPQVYTVEVDLGADPDGDLSRLSLWWDFEIEGEGSGLSVPDLSGSGADGVTGGTSSSPSFLACR